VGSAMIYFLYILHSLSAGKYYVGISSDPERRLSYHNTIEKGFTSRYRPWEIVYMKEFPDKKNAQLAECKVKSWKSSLMIRKLLNGEIDL
jgi:predicted GIY-YIG superfamily endonuclease